MLETLLFAFCFASMMCKAFSAVAYKPKIKEHERVQIACSKDGFNYIIQGFDINTIALQEQLVVLYLDRSMKVVGLYRAAVGGMTGVVADIRIILAVALKIFASSLIVAHNHPSGSLKPSTADHDLTNKLKESAKLMDLKLLDHFIIEPSCEQYYSFADEGWL